MLRRLLPSLALLALGVWLQGPTPEKAAWGLCSAMDGTNDVWICFGNGEFAGQSVTYVNKARMNNTFEDDLKEHGQ